MNFGSGGGGGGGAAGGSSASAAPDLEQIETEQLAFHAIAGEDKLQLLPSPWPADQLPSPTSSLLSIASAKGLLAAAGPETLVIAQTDSVRHAFLNNPAGADKTKTFTPQASIPIPRVSQVVFSSDESCLVIAAEQGGGLAVYDTNALLNAGKEAAFQLATQGQSVRQLLPNPNPASDLSRYFGIVTESGQFLLADLKEQKLLPASSGSPVFHENVSCASWSRLGKQIVAGLADGTAVQIDQQGVVKASIPAPPQLVAWKEEAPALAHPVTSIFWLDTHDFLLVHTPVHQSSSAADGGMNNDDSIYHLAHRDKQSGTWTFSRFMDPCPPFGMETRKPAHHFVLRLRDWLSLSDLLILSSTASTDVGTFTRSRTSLSPETALADVFTYTQFPDSRRAALPMAADGADTSPIGMCLDLSVKEKLPRPIPNEEALEESPVPLPALMVLDNEGRVSMWYIIYNESVRKAEAYGDLVASGGPRALGGVGETKPQQQPQAAQAQTETTRASPFAASTSTTTSPFGSAQQTQSTFGAPSQSTSTFGQPTAPAFGGTSSLGMRQSPWGASNSSTGQSGATFGKPSFGSSTFGQPGGGMGMSKGSVWGTPSQSSQQQQNSSATSTFGSGAVFGGNASQSSPFMNLGGGGQSPFAAASSKTTTTTSAQNPSSKSTSAFGGFNLSSNQTGQSQPSPFASAKPSLPAEQSGSTVSFGSGMSFGSGNTSFGVRSFGSPTPTPTLSGQTQSREESMQDNNDEDQRSEASTLKPASDAQAAGGGLFGLSGGGFKLGSTFKPDGSANDDLPKPKDAGAGLFGKGFGEALGLGDAKEDDRKRDTSQSGSEAAWMSGRSTPVVSVKKEPGTEEPVKLGDIPPAKASDQRKGSAGPPPVDDAPLPPDPTTWKPKPGALPAPIPPGFGDDFSASTTPKATDVRAPSKVEEAPLPPDPASAAPSKLDMNKVSVAPPVDLSGAKFSRDEASPTTSHEAAGPPESEGDEGDWSDEEESSQISDEEGDDVDEDEENRTPQVIEDPTGLSAFESRLTPASPKRGQAQQQGTKPLPSPSQPITSTTPATVEKKDSYTPAGLPKAPIMFQPPQRQERESPRSPSPQRSATSPVRSMAPTFGASSLKSQSTAANPALSFGKPSLQPQEKPVTPPTQLPLPSQAKTTSLFQSSTDTTQTTSQSRAMAQSQSQPQQPQRIAVPPSQLAPPEKSTASAKPAVPQEGDLEDEEDARVQATLAAPIEPSREVPSFLAHQDYVAHGQEREGLGGQIERVFRDVNSMLDTLALNARALRGFVEGNLAGSAQGERSRLDLEEEDGWTLGEVGELEKIMEGIGIELEDGRLEDAGDALEGLRDDEKEIIRLKGKCADARKAIAAHADPNLRAQMHAAPLPMENQAQLSELRQGVQRLQELLAKAEEGLSILRSELASQHSSQGGAGADGAGSKAIPTVEAVTNTILKMTAIIEKKSGDIDVLESRIRRLGGPATISGLKAGYEDELAASLNASRLSHSSPTVRRAGTGFGASGHGSPAATARPRVTPSPGPGAALGRRSLFEVPDTDVEDYRRRREGKRKAMERLRELLDARGGRVVKVVGM